MGRVALRRPPVTLFLRAGAALALFFALSLTAAFYSWVLRPNLGLYREPAWVAQHPGFQKQMRQRIEKNLWQKSTTTTNPDRLSATERARAVALFNDIEDFGHEFEAAFSARNQSAAETGVWRLLNLLKHFNAVVKGTGYEFSPGIFDDLTKVRQALSEGDWDKVQGTARHNDAYAREFKRIAAWVVELARQQQADATSTALRLAASIRLIQPDPVRHYWRWQIQRSMPARLIYGVLEVTDPQHPERVLMGMEKMPAQGVQDYVLRLNPERDQWRVEVEDIWAGESGGRGATWQPLRCPSNADLTATAEGLPRQLTATNYTILWKGEVSTSGRKLKSLWFVARLARVGDPATDLLDPSDAVRTFDGNVLPLRP
jgi:hypothetical protein